MGNQDDRRHIYLTPVYADRADDFERFVSSTLMPALRKVRPELEARAQTLRATDAEGDVLYFAFILDGGDQSDWVIESLLIEALGEEAGARESGLMDQMIKGDQTGATFRALRSLT